MGDGDTSVDDALAAVTDQDQTEHLPIHRTRVNILPQQTVNFAINFSHKMANIYHYDKFNKLSKKGTAVVLKQSRMILNKFLYWLAIIIQNCIHIK